MSTRVKSCEDFLLVAAIDFGTTYSGYAYSTKEEHHKIILNDYWNAGCYLSPKTPTCVLLSPDKQFDSFGYDAEKKYSVLTESNDHHDWYFFKHFKMRLYSTKGLNRTTTIDDNQGKSVPALTVFTMSIRFLKDHLMKFLQKHMPGIRQTCIKFVITVPAIWDDTAKQFMREAATQAGIDGENLKIALEPEAASICCQDLPVVRTEGASTGTKLEILGAGTQYMVLDLGGGTADITVHEKNANGSLKEIYAATGGPWGGTAVDENFLNFLAEIVGEEIMDWFEKGQPEDKLDLMRDFERKKVTIEPSLEGLVSLKLPESLLSKCKESGKTIQNAVASSKYNKSLKVSRDKIRLRVDVVKSLFYGPIESILRHLSLLFEKPEFHKVSTIIMVGGFSECKLVQYQVKKTFQDTTIIIPPECETAVLKGAVIFGHNEQSVSTRIARYTYGEVSMKRFNPSEHRPGNKVSVHGKEYCDNLFHAFVRKGQEIHVGYSVESTTKPTEVGQKGMDVFLFRSTSADPIYVTEDSCSLLGQVEVPLAETKDRRVHHKIIFGDTELIYIGKQLATGKKVKRFFELH